VELRTAKLQQALYFEGVLRAISSRMVVSLNEGKSWKKWSEPLPKR